MLWIIYIILFIVAGIISWNKILPGRNILETILIGILWGMILSCAIPFLFGLILPFYIGIILLGVFCLITIIIRGYWIRSDWKEILHKIKNYIKKEKKSLIILLVTFFIIAIPYLLLASRILFEDQNGWYATGIRSAYGDVAFHLMYILSFAFGENFPPQNPDFAGTLSNYPFLPYILNASLLKLGANLINGFMVPVYILSIVIVALLIFVPWQITRKIKVSILVPIIFFFSGGLGFLWFFKANGLNLLLWGNKIGSVVINEPTNIPEFGINFMNVILASLLPQKGILFGLPIFLAVILLWFKPTNRSIIASAFLVAPLPLLHVQTFIALFIVLPFFLLIQTIRKSFSYSSNSWIWFFMIVFTITLPAIIFFRPNINDSTVKFIHFTYGWMMKGNGFFEYWIKNLGIFLPLLIVALFSKKTPTYLKIWYLPFVTIFFVANFIIFSPWGWDNHKFFHLWFLISSFLVAFFIVNLLENRKLIIKIIALICMVFLLLSGGIEAIRMGIFSIKQYKVAGYYLFSPAAQELAEFLKTNTPQKSIFLASTSHLSPVVLSGRERTLGFIGWLWAHGINYQERLNDEKLIYQGGDQAKLLLKKWGITHILIGDEELNEFSVNLPFFEENYEKIYDKNNYKVFIVK